MNWIFKVLRTNVQTNQTIILLILLLLGIFYYQINFSLTKLIYVFSSVIGFELLFSRIRDKKWSFPYSGIPAWFGIAFFLRTDTLILYVLAGFLAIASKYIFQIREKHFFNPSNFGVFLVLVFFPWMSWTNPLQWGRIYHGFELNLLYILIVSFGLFILWRVKINKSLNLLYIVVPFFITHLSILYYFSAETITSYHLIYSPSFFIFTFFMITDPQTILVNRISRVLFGWLVAVVFYILQYFINENYSLLASLFLLTMIIPVTQKWDSTIYYKKITFWNVFIFSLFFICLVTIFLLHYRYWIIDLTFDNRCRSLFCI